MSFLHLCPLGHEAHSSDEKGPPVEIALLLDARPAVELDALDQDQLGSHGVERSLQRSAALGELEALGVVFWYG